MTSESKESKFWWGIAVGIIGTAVAATAIYYAVKPKAKEKQKQKISPLKKIREIINRYQSDSSIREVAAKITQNCSAWASTGS